MVKRFLLSMMAGLCTAALAAPPTAAPPPSQPPPSQSSQSIDATGNAASDAEFIEFLGTDDVGDAAWWEFLKKKDVHSDPASRPPPPPDASS